MFMFMFMCRFRFDRLRVFDRCVHTLAGLEVVYR